MYILKNGIADYIPAIWLGPRLEPFRRDHNIKCHNVLFDFHMTVSRNGNEYWLFLLERNVQFLVDLKHLDIYMWLHLTGHWLNVIYFALSSGFGRVKSS